MTCKQSAWVHDMMREKSFLIRSSEDAEQTGRKTHAPSLHMLCIHLVTFPTDVERPASVISLAHRPPALLPHSVAWA